MASINNHKESNKTNFIILAGSYSDKITILGTSCYHFDFGTSLRLLFGIVKQFDGFFTLILLDNSFNLQTPLKLVNYYNLLPFHVLSILSLCNYMVSDCFSKNPIKLAHFKFLEL